MLPWGIFMETSNYYLVYRVDKLTEHFDDFTRVVYIFVG
jgi:hypothetical protein